MHFHLLLELAGGRLQSAEEEGGGAGPSPARPVQLQDGQLSTVLFLQLGLEALNLGPRARQQGGRLNSVDGDQQLKWIWEKEL